MNGSPGITAGYGAYGAATAAGRAPPAIERDPATALASATVAPTGDTVTLSPAAARLMAARENLTMRESSPVTCTPAEWQRLQCEASVTTERRPAADAHILRLETDDPDHARTARQAKAFNYDSANLKSQHKNPFSGLDRVSLTAIVADEAGLYANDEREAAEREMNHQEHAWQDPLMLASGGASYRYFEEAGRQYYLLSPLERSGYPADYPSQCQRTADYEKSRKENDPYWWMDSAPKEDVSPAERLKLTLAKLDGGDAPTSAPAP